jgi:UDP-N-acetylglucosamine--N-acetylmuramyl-(pentapeptide) pyrophosphoryl-undecaprenol N-acetylglucosamine transferase
MRAILAGGGTGGHVIPALAIAHELKDLFQAEVRFIGTARGIENRLVPAAGFGLDLIEIGALNKVSLATRLRTVFALPSAIAQARRILSSFRPEVVIGVGGYASGPVMLAAALLSIPLVSFEPNVVPGLANRIAAPLVTAAAVHFQETCSYFRRCRVTGVPVRSQFFRAEPRDGTEPTTLLVFGGSQGAHAINEAVISALPLLQERCPGLRIIHQTGEKDYLIASTAYLHSDIAAEVSPFIDDMPHAFARAELVLCRSGASTVAEITAAGKAAIFVPFPHAADDHQRRNAEALVRAGAALMILESELTPQRLEEAVISLLGDGARLASMSAAAKKLSHPNAAREIALMAARLAGWSAPPSMQRNAARQQK